MDSVRLGRRAVTGRYARGCGGGGLGSRADLNAMVALDIIGTHPAARRRGVATMLVNWGLERAREDGLEVYLSSTQEGRFVYERLGFEVRSTGEVDGYV
ncbi:unnamed protein product [Aspergillus oryzae]|uniref:Unnamed protein product n=2 Tax=Aspergillus oryzae TaxID=5062 RepID=A0AAN4YSG9_ASPOZ|nr:unnamed protein product [Aspergillus oryzae]GMF97145.1 unnamed protein product [Aspergillus oryzae]GMG33244.1 unnamed protein product [Aspergillus oryzae]